MPLTTDLQTITLGPNGPTVPALGVGTWAWGDSLFWDYGKAYSDSDLHAAFDACLDAGLTTGLKFADIQPVYLAPADARAAFVRGEVDAWSIWDPFFAAAEVGTNARVLVNAEGLNKQGGYYIASRKFASEQPKILKEVLEEVRNLETWSDKNRDEVATVLTAALKLDAEAVKKATQRRNFGLIPVTDDLITEQQKVADTYYQLKLIPKQISIRDAILPPDKTAAFALN